MIRRERRTGRTIGESIRELREPSRHRLLELAGIDAPDAEARRHLAAIERTHAALERALGHEVRLEVAALDYLTRGPAPVAPDLRVIGRAALERILDLASTDALTGVLNRRGLESVLERETARALRSRRSLSLLAVDVDDFKRVNDRHGHPRGDRVLSRLAAILVRHSRASDAVARLGGDEFAVLLPETALEGARSLAERILVAVSGTDLLAGCATREPGERVTISIGVASGLLGAREIAARADRALFAAKRAGRNCSSAA